MLHLRSEADHEEMSEGGTRYLFRLDHYEFHDTLDGHGELHYFVVEPDDPEARHYETDQPTMYEFMARYLAGVYEKTHYEMERSPTHAALMDTMEMATARARSGDSGFAFDTAGEMEEDAEEADEFEDEDPTDYHGV